MNALLLFSYATINSMDDIKPFYEHLYHGPVPEDKLSQVKNAFQEIGTRDPLGSNTKRIGEALTRRLEAVTGEKWKYYIGNKHIFPFVDDAVDQCVNDGVSMIATLALTPFYSRTGTQFYEKQVLQALEKKKLSEIPLKHVPSFSNCDAFVHMMYERLDDALHWFPESVRENTEVVFTAHSMPGTPKAHQTFIEQYTTLANNIATRANVKQHHIAYRSGKSSSQRWLEPDVLDVIDEIAQKGAKAVVVCELLSIIANTEAIHELGNEARQHARQLGLAFVQTEYINDSEAFITALITHIQKTILSQA